MAVTRVTHTTKGFDAINYALKGTPHVVDKYVSGRVLTSSGINCTVHGCRTQMNAVWKRYGINRPTRKHRRQVQRLIQSFDPNQLDYRKSADVAKANSIGRKLASKLYPNRQSIVVTQADNERHILHNHIITNMLDFRTGKSMTGKQTSWRTVQRASDKVISQDFGMNPESNKRMIKTANGRKPEARVHQTDAEYHIKHRKAKYGNYSWVTDIRARINSAKNKAMSWSSFINLCRKGGVICDPYRKHKEGIRRNKNGNPVFKKRISFRFTGKDGKHHRIRDRKLGTDFGKPALNKAFVKNQEPEHQHNSAIISDSLDLKPFLQKSDSQQSSSSSRPISHATEEQSYMASQARREHSLAISANLSASASSSASMSASRSASVSASSASYSASVSQSMSASFSASISQSASLSASVSTANNPVAKHSKAVSLAYISASASHNDRIGSIQRLNNPAIIQQKYMPNPTWKRVVNDYRNYNDVSAPSLTIGQAMPQFSTDKVRKSAPFVYGSVLQTKVIAKDKGVKEFHVISNELNYTDNDVSLVHRVMDPLVNGFRSVSHKVRNWAYVNWRKGKYAISQYFHKKSWDMKLTGFNTHYKKVFERNIGGVMFDDEWVDEPTSKTPIYKQTSHPFKLADLIPKTFRYRSRKGKIHFAYNKQVDDYNSNVDRKYSLIKSVDNLPKSISSEFSSLVAPIMQDFNNVSAKAFNASSASASASSASSSALAFNASYSANEISNANARLNNSRESISASDAAWRSSYYWANDSLASYANGASDYDSALSHLDKLEKSTRVTVSGKPKKERDKALNKYTKPRKRLIIRSESSAKISLSNARRTSSIADLTYFGWSMAKHMAISNDNWHEFNKLVSAGNHEYTRYTGSYGYYTKAYKNSNVNFNQFSSLVRDDKSYSASVSRSQAIHHGHGWSY